MPLNVAITGATGFIGSQILREFLSSEARVIVLLRPDSDTSRIADAGSFEQLKYKALSDSSTVSELSEFEPDVFVCCGWRGVGGSERNEAFQVTENIPTTIASVELASGAGCRQWIGLGSQAEYGNQNRVLDESAQLLPTTCYGKAKLAAGIASLALCEIRGMAGAWLRVFSTYGPNDAPSWFIPYIMQEFLAGRSPKLTKCEQLWDYLFVSDAARAVTSVAESGASGVFNLGSGKSRSLREFITAIKDELDATVEPEYGAVPYRPDQVMHLEADISRLTSLTGWVPRVSLTEGIRATAKFERTRQSQPK